MPPPHGVLAFVALVALFEPGPIQKSFTGIFTGAASIGWAWRNLLFLVPESASSAIDRDGISHLSTTIDALMMRVVRFPAC
jgi:hypothetical protein